MIAFSGTVFAVLFNRSEQIKVRPPSLLGLDLNPIFHPERYLTVTLGAGETIWTESSYKYGTGEVLQMAGRAGFDCHAQWTDEEWPFAESLFIAAQ